MDVNKDIYDCNLYIDADEEISILLQNIANLFDTKSIDNKICVDKGILYLCKNNKFHKINKKNPEDGFLFYQYFIKAKPNALFGEENAVQFISTILNFFWSKGYPAIAFCDYENNLPNRGGYKSPNIPNP